MRRFYGTSTRRGRPDAVPRRRRRRSGSLGYTPRAGSVFLSPKAARRRRRRGPALVLLGGVAVVAALAGAASLAARTVLKPDHRREAVVAFAAAWTRGDRA